MIRSPDFRSEPGRLNDGPLLFVVEYRNRLEKRLAEKCLGRLAAGACRWGWGAHSMVSRAGGPWLLVGRPPCSFA